MNPEVVTEYGTCAIGVFGPLGQNLRPCATETEAREKAHGNPYHDEGPVTRKVVVIDGETFATPWVLLAKSRDEIENWKPSK